MPSHALPGSASWVRLLALFSVASLIEVIFWGQVSAFTPLYLPHLGIAPADIPGWTGTITALSSGIGIPLLPLWGALADRYARQPIIVRSFVVHLVAAVLTLLAGNIWVFVLARSVQSFALGNSGLMMTTLAEHAPRGRQNLAFSILNGAGPLGAFLGPLLGGPIVDAWGFPALMAVDSVLMLGVVVALTFGYRDTFRGSNRGPLLRMAWASVGVVGSSARLRALFPALFLLFAGWMLALTYVPIAIGTLYHGADIGTVIGLVLGAGGLVTLVLSPAMGLLGDRVGAWRVLLVSGSILAAAWALPLLATDIRTFALAWALINGLASGVFSLSFSVLADSARPEERGRVMSFAYLPVNLGFAAGPAIGSLIIAGHSVFAVFPAAVVLTTLGVGALVYASRQPVDRTPPSLVESPPAVAAPD